MGTKSGSLGGLQALEGRYSITIFPVLTYTKFDTQTCQVPFAHC